MAQMAMTLGGRGAEESVFAEPEEPVEPTEPEAQKKPPVVKPQPRPLPGAAMQPPPPEAAG